MNTSVEPMTYDLSTCDREPIHRLGKIQSGGGMLVLSADWLVVAFSENVPKILRREEKDLLGHPLVDLISPEATRAITGLVKRFEDEDQLERILDIKLFSSPDCYDLSAHFSSDKLILEFTPAYAEASDMLSQDLRSALRRLGKAEGSLQLCDQAARSVASMVRFDRVMIYKFHPDGSGEVVAEHRLSDIDSFLGLRYPPSDIPQQARALYKRSILRVIPDIDDTGLLITPCDAEVDLSLSTLRTVSPVHIEYLRNMGVQASMSISIMVDGELWGLIACHHYSPRDLSMITKSYTELYAESFALELRSQLEREARTGEGGGQKLHVQMMASLDPSLPLFENLSAFGGRIKSLIKCDALVLSIDGERAVFGDPVSSEDVDLLVKRLNRQATTRVTAVENLRNWLDMDVTIAERFAGVLAVPISKRPRDLLLFLRREEVTEVQWAGNPEKPVELGPNGSRLTPRKSFAAWQQLREEFCAPWSPLDLNLANDLRGTLLELVVRNIDERNKLAAEAQQQQDMLIHELNHRVRNILGLINSIVGQTATSVESVDEFKGILAGRIQALALAQNMLTEGNWANTPFTTLIQTELNAFVTEPDRVKVIGPDVLLTPKAYTTMTLLVHELITNSIKYGALSTPTGSIEIQWTVDAHSSMILTWKELGVTVEEPPTRRGFGSLIIERAIPLDLGGESEHKITRDGARARFIIPDKHFTYSDEDHEPSGLSGETRLDEQVQESVESESVGDNNQLSVALVVEDNMIIGLDEESALSEMGFKEVHLAASVASAMQIIARGQLSFAVLDVNLGVESSEPIAEELYKLGVPFIFASGYDEGLERLTQRFSAPLLRKPFTSTDIKLAARNCLDAFHNPET